MHRDPASPDVALNPRPEGRGTPLLSVGTDGTGGGRFAAAGAHAKAIEITALVRVRVRRDGTGAACSYFGGMEGEP